MRVPPQGARHNLNSTQLTQLMSLSPQPRLNMLKLVAVSVLVLVVVMEAEAGCRDWCKKPGDRFYCCDDGSGVGSYKENPGKCPHRPACVAYSRTASARDARAPPAPVMCSHDGQCSSRKVLF
ncbi:hypothetical protein GWK47_006084 [Chionoecetes opilio]|uniref:Uncharacterized protein n=1 Tax=Chionoecetes opilio TaxID=41210 RepID=A0A8J5CVJ7_CHIOP|nr:hypothetical protein GWK47_006084 [Chionoecetes opilio]